MSARTKQIECSKSSIGFSVAIDRLPIGRNTSFVVKIATINSHDRFLWHEAHTICRVEIRRGDVLDVPCSLVMGSVHRQARKLLSSVRNFMSVRGESQPFPSIAATARMLRIAAIRQRALTARLALRLRAVYAAVTPARPQGCASLAFHREDHHLRSFHRHTARLRTPQGAGSSSNSGSAGC